MLWSTVICSAGEWLLMASRGNQQKMPATNTRGKKPARNGRSRQFDPNAAQSGSLSWGPSLEEANDEMPSASSCPDFIHVNGYASGKEKSTQSKLHMGVIANGDISDSPYCEERHSGKEGDIIRNKTMPKDANRDEVGHNSVLELGHGMNGVCFPICNGTDGSVKPKKPVPDKQLPPSQKTKRKLQTKCETRGGLGSENSSTTKPMQRNNFMKHNSQSSVPGSEEDVVHQNGFVVNSLRTNGTCSSTESSPSSEEVAAMVCVNSCEVDGMWVPSRDSELAPDMVDEGAVCDFDKLVFSDWHNSPIDNGRQMDNGNDFSSFSLLDLPMDDEFACSTHSNSQLCHFRDSARCDLHSNCKPFCGHGMHLSNSVCTELNSPDFLQLSDDIGERHSNLPCDNQENCEDTGDFIDTDLPARDLRMFSSSAGSSSSSLDGGEDDDDDEETYQSFPNPVFREGKENNLSFESKSLNSMIGLCLQKHQGDKRRGVDDFKCKVFQRGDNYLFSRERTRGPSRGLVVHNPGHVNNSSESENGDDFQGELFLNCDVNEVFNADGASGTELQSEIQNIRPGHFSGVGSEHCFICSGTVKDEISADQHRDNGHCFTASGSGMPSVATLSQALPPGSASSQHGCGTPAAIVAQPCVNDLSRNLIFPRHLNMEPSNFQNDKSNNQQKVFMKFCPMNQERRRTVGHGQRDLGRMGSPNSPDHSKSSHENGIEERIDTELMAPDSMSAFDQETMVLSLASELEQARVNSESGVSEPIYEDIESFPDVEESGNIAASGEPVDSQQQNVDSQPRKSQRRATPRRKERRSSSGGKSGIEKVMIWNEYEAYVLQVKQIGTSACGPTAVLNVLKAFNVCIDKDEVCKKIHTHLREESADAPQYLFSRAVAGTTAEDLLSGIEMLTGGRIRGRFFHFWPPREIYLLKWLGHWMKKGAVPLATLNLQKGVKPGWIIPDAWHHQMVYGVSSKGLYLTNPLENVTEETVMEQLNSDSVLYVRRQDVVSRFRDTTDLGEILRHPDKRWCTLNVLGQVVNVLRESSTTHVPGYRPQLTSHISIPAVYKAGITLFVQSESEVWQELQNVPSLRLKRVTQT